MVYVTGDLHGHKERFLDNKLKKLTKDDILIVCGDFGFIWNGSKKEKSVLKWLEKRKFKILFVEGVHENFALLEEFQTVELYGGKARKINNNIFQLIKGEVYSIENNNYFCFGGGSMDPKTDLDFDFDFDFYSLNGASATLEEIQNAQKNLDSFDWSVDYVITHDAPTSVKGFINIQDDNFALQKDFLEEISENCKFKRWFFGHYHIDKIVTPSYTAVFKNVIALNK